MGQIFSDTVFNSQAYELNIDISERSLLMQLKNVDLN